MKSKGVLLFAFSTQEIDYLKIAEKNSRLIKKFLNLPVSVVTDVDYHSNVFNVIKVEKQEKNNVRIGFNPSKSWKNFDRCAAYDLSPYDTTLLLDVDCIILDNFLLKYFDLCEDYLILNNQYFFNGKDGHTLGIYGIPHKWATIVIFNKTKKTKLMFDLIKKIQNNYEYYRNLYQIRVTNFRNDFAFTIADLIINGYNIQSKNVLQHKIFAIDENVKELILNDDMIYMLTDKSGYVIPKITLHFIDKYFLFDEKFDIFCDRILNE